MASTGLFGSTIGGKASQRPKPLLTPGRAPLKAPAVHESAPPAFHVPAALHLAASLTGIDMRGGGAGGGAASLKPGHPTSMSSGAVAAGGGSHGLDFGAAFGAVEGFMSHLSSDIVHTTLGMPMGLVYLAEHPVAGAEGIVKATWNDWSPLFHGDVRTWLHNTYEHPLGPILDLVGFATFGAGTAARGAGAIGKIGEVAKGVDTAGQIADASVAAARASHTVMQAAHDAGRVAGETSFKTSTFMQKALRFSNPAAYSARVYASMAVKLGLTDTEAQLFVERALEHDPLARRMRVSEGGLKHGYRDVSRNPLIRARQAQVAKLGQKLEASSKYGKLPDAFQFGDKALYKRWSRMDHGSRAAAVAIIIQRQLHAMHAAGKALDQMHPWERAAAMHPVMWKGLWQQAHEVAPAGAIDSAAEKARHDAMISEGYQYAMAPEHAGPAVERALKELAAKGEAGIGDFYKEKWAKAVTTNDPLKAAKNARGDYLVVSAPDKFAKEAVQSTWAVRKLYKNPTAVWKYFLLGAAPRYFVNNFVGNSLMLMAATDPVSLTRAFRSYMKLNHGAKAERAMMEDSILATTHPAAKQAALAPNRAVWANYKQQKLAQAAAGQGAHVAGLERQVAEYKLGEAVRAGKGGTWMDEWLGSEYGMGNSQRIDPATGRPATGQGLEGLVAKANEKYSLHRFTHEHADMPQRKMGMIYSMKRIPEFQQRYARLRASGHSHFQAEDMAARSAMTNPAVRQIIRSQVNHMFGQYHTFTRWERNIQNVIPFYSWDRAIAVHVRSLFEAEPYKLAMGAAIGSMGNVKTQEILGQVPDFMLGALPAKVLSGPVMGLLGQIPGGRQAFLNTYGLNPYTTVGDTANLLTSVLPGNKGNRRVGESFGAQINPLIQAAASELGGVNIQSGAPAKPSQFGPLAGVYADTFGSLPQWTLLKIATGHGDSNITKKGKPTLYDKSFLDAFSSFMGAPVKRANMTTASAMANLQGGGKPPKKGRRKGPYIAPSVPGL